MTLLDATLFECTLFDEKSTSGNYFVITLSWLLLIYGSYTLICISEHANWIINLDCLWIYFAKMMMLVVLSSEKKWYRAY